MDAMGIIFLACLAFAIAILILITCCFFKVNGGKDSRDLEIFKGDTTHRIPQINQNKIPNGSTLSRQNPNVILFLNKKNKHSSESTHLNKTRDNSRQRINDVDGVWNDNVGNQNDEPRQNDSDHRNDNNCKETGNHVQAETCSSNNASNGGNKGGISNTHGNGNINHSHGTSYGFQGTNHQSHSTSHYDHGIGHFNEGFSSHFSGSHHGWGHHSGHSDHYGGHDGDHDGDHGGGDDD